MWWWLWLFTCQSAVVDDWIWYHKLHFNAVQSNPSSSTPGALHSSSCLFTSTANTSPPLHRDTAELRFPRFASRIFHSSGSSFYLHSQQLLFCCGTLFFAHRIRVETTKWHNLTRWNRQAPTTKKHLHSSTNAATNVLRSRVWEIC